MTQKLKPCRVCGAEIAKNAKTCPSCGAKNKKPVYLRPWFILLAIVLAAAVAGSSGSSDKEGSVSSSPNSAQASVSSGSQIQEDPEVVYTPYSVAQMMDDLNSNALKASKTYDDQYVEISGKLDVIDSSGDYISLVPSNNSFYIIGVQCYITTEDQLEQIMEMSIGDSVTLRGKITDVGEILGYSMNIDSIVT